jgi:oligopeptide/dipeptide ABC transporter ATP-binding protein
VAKTVAVMYAGRIVELGPTATVFETPRHPYTRLLMRAVPSLDKAEVMEGIEGQPPRPASRPVGCSFAPRCAGPIRGAAHQRSPGHPPRRLGPARSGCARGGRLTGVVRHQRGAPRRQLQSA